MIIYGTSMKSKVGVLLMLTFSLVSQASKIGPVFEVHAQHGLMHTHFTLLKQPGQKTLVFQRLDEYEELRISEDDFNLLVEEFKALPRVNAIPLACDRDFVRIRSNGGKASIGSCFFQKSRYSEKFQAFMQVLHLAVLKYTSGSQTK